MEKLTICTWLWGDKYSIADVNKLVAGIKRHLKQPYRFLLITDQPNDVYECLPIHDPELLNGCFARLRMFDIEWQQKNNITGRLACMDLDTVITGPLDELFDRDESFSILQGANSSNPCPYNGSIFMLKAGAHSDVWSDFSIEAAAEVPFYEFPDDQGWLAHKIPSAGGWQVGSGTGIYAFGKPGWPKGETLPMGARIVVFPGWRSPEKFKHLPWVRENWNAA